MADISAALVKTLRERTGAGMMDCKRALRESGGDPEAAVDWLRSHGLSAAAKRAGRVASEGLIGVCVDGTRGALVEVNSETDFVARNELFRGFVGAVGRLALDSGGDVDALLRAPYPEGGGTVADRLNHLIATIGENMAVRRAAVVEVGSGLVGAYVHAAQGEGIGRIGVLVGLECDRPGAGLAVLGKHLAMHVAAANPLAVSREQLDPALLDRERRIAREQAQASGKPANVVEKIVEGRMAKFFQEVCLLDQTYVVDGESKIAKVIDQTASEVGAPVRVARFARFALGEGLTKEAAESGDPATGGTA
jgi:elongation factor Ts